MGIFMGARKIVERVVVNGITGEVLDSQISFVKWQSERFLMMRTTYGVEFLMGLSKVELVLFFMLSCFADGYGLVSLYKDRKVKLCDKLGISGRSLRRSIVGLVDGGLLKQKGDDLMINPNYVFKCSTKDLKDRINKYELWGKV